ncbi:MAG: AI-2E family transporter [Ruminococcaceae bacterium]|nr:AI-2E family transporter [Oscillospiraceae bacterium]
MKFKKNEKYASIAFYAFISIGGAALFTLGLINFGALMSGVKRFFEVLSPLTYGFVIAYLCTPLVNLFERKVFRFRKSKKERKILKRVLSITVAYIVLILCITAFIVILVPQIVNSYNDLTGHVGQYIATAQSWADDFVRHFPLFNGQYENLGEFLDVNEISADIRSIISNSYKYIETASNYIISYAGKFVIEIKNLIIGIFFAVYLLFYKERLSAQLKKLTAAIFSRKAYLNVVNLSRYTHEAFGGFIIGKILDSLIIGILTFILTGIFKMPFFPLLSLVVGVTNVIPIFGPFIGAIPTAFIVLIAEPRKVFLFILLIIIIQQLDGNVIGPKILGDKVGIGAMWVMVSIIIAGGFFGLTGMVLGVPTFAVIYTLTKQFAESRLKKKALPDDTDFYRSDPPKINFKTEDVLIGKTDDIPEKLEVKPVEPEETEE